MVSFCKFLKKYALYIAKCARGAGENSMSLRRGLHGPSAKAGERSREYVIPRNTAPAFKPPPFAFVSTAATLLLVLDVASGYYG